MYTGLLPIGTVVLLKGSTKRVMIIGVCQRSAEKPEELWDYSGCLFPEGYIGPDKVFLFNNDQLEKIFSTGFRDEEQMAFNKKAEQAIQKLRS